MVHLVALLQAAQDRDRVFDRRLLDHDLLEAPLQRSVFLKVQTVFIQGRRPNAVEFSARQRRLQHVAGIHRAFGLARAHHGVQLVDEQDHLAFLLGQLVEYGLEPFFELATELRAGNQRGQIQRQDAFGLQSLRNFAIDDPLGEPFDDRGLADAGLANQYRVVLGSSLQHLKRAPDLFVPADDRIELALLGPLRQIDGVFVERLTIVFGIRVVDRLATADLVDGFLHRALDCACRFQYAAQIARIL